MLTMFLTVLRFLILGILYLFIFKIIIFIFDDLRQSSDVTTNRAEMGQGEVENQAVLVVIASTDNEFLPGTRVYLRNKILLGRSPDSDIKINDKFVSSEHAVISYRNGQYWIEDLNSLNGTYLNGTKLNEPAVLADGDRLRVGGVSFEFVRWAYAVEPDNRNRVGQEG